MLSSRQPLLMMLLTFLTFMLYQAWVIDHTKVDKPGSEAAETLPKIDETTGTTPAFSKAAQKAVVIDTDLIRVKINKRGGFVERVWLKDYPNSLGDPSPFTLFDYQERHAYVAQTGFSGDSELVFTCTKDIYRLSDKADTLVVELDAAGPDGITYTKKFTFHRNRYHFDVTSQVENDSALSWEGSHYANFSGYEDTLLSGGKLPLPKHFNVDPDAPKPGWFTFNTYTGPAYYTANTPYTKLSFADMANKKLQKVVEEPNWIAVQQRYFIAAWINSAQDTNTGTSQDSDAKQDGNQVVSSNWQSGSTGSSGANYRQSFDLSSQSLPVSLEPGEQATRTSTLYAGPELVANLAPLAKGLELTIDYGWLWFISDILFQILNFVHKYLGSWGWAIIVTTLLVKLVFYKMSEASYRSMALQRKLKPKLDAIQKRFQDDPEKRNQAVMELYQKEKINPLSGCLPSLLQIPFFLALYYVLIESIQLRLAGFLWIPDLSSQDPYYILPILLAASMVLTQRLSPPQSDPAQQRAMQLVPFIFGGMFSQFPAGLVLYWLTNNLLSFVQQYYIMRKYQAL